MPEEILELKKYKVVGKIEAFTPEGEGTGEFLEEGSIQTVPEELGESWIVSGVAEEYIEEEPLVGGEDPVDPTPEVVEVSTKEICKDCLQTGLESPTKLCEKCKGYGEVSLEE